MAVNISNNSVKYNSEKGTITIRNNDAVVEVSFGYPENETAMKAFIKGTVDYLYINVFDANGGSLERIDKDTYKFSANAGGFGFSLKIDATTMNDILMESWTAHLAHADE